MYKAHRNAVMYIFVWYETSAVLSRDVEHLIKDNNCHILSQSDE